MVKRGPVSKEQRELDDELGTMDVTTIEIAERPMPHFDFDNQEATIWSTIVNSMPADWFNTGSIPLLTQYVRHVVASRNIAQLIADATSNSEEINVKLYILFSVPKKKKVLRC